MPKKYDKFPVNFQIVLSTYKLDCQNKNYIYKIKTQSFFFFFLLKKASSHARCACDETSNIFCVNGNLITTYNKNCLILSCFSVSLDSIESGSQLCLAFFWGLIILFIGPLNSAKYTFPYIFESHSTIHTFKNYFVAVFSIISFSFQQINNIQTDP